MISSAVKRRHLFLPASVGTDYHNETHHDPTGTGDHRPIGSNPQFAPGNSTYLQGTSRASGSGIVCTTTFLLPSLIEGFTSIPSSSPTTFSARLAFQRRLVHIPSDGHSSSNGSDGTLASLTATDTGTGVIHATGTGATGAVFATRTVLLARVTYAVVRGLKKLRGVSGGVEDC